MAEIQRAEELLLLGSSGTNQHDSSCANNNRDELDSNINNQVIPSDRHRVWPGVQERRSADDDSLAADDASKLTSQLGYVPGNAIRVAARVSDVSVLKNLKNEEPDAPVVLQLYPIVIRDVHPGGKAGSRKFKSRRRTNQETVNNNNKMDGPSNQDPGESKNNSVQHGQVIGTDDDNFVVEPFPTLYWLTHPLLRTLVSKLELKSMGIELEQRLSKEAGAMAFIERAHMAYGQERYNLLTESDIAYIQQRKWEGAFSPSRGVSGICNYAAVKCLHAHVAHYLSGGKGSSDNIVGRWVTEAISEMILESTSATDAKGGKYSDPLRNDDDCRLKSGDSSLAVVAAGSLKG
jgi:hypothetical protein